MKYAFFFILLYGINHKTFSQWNNLSINSTQFLYGAYFLNNDTGFVFSDGVVFKTNDGGINWNSPALAITSKFTAMTL
ncbi:MAG: hypothetical protein IPP29_06865 [Bacteroidetes bacterium]|nr:hypothetical protein [Bacteroidota bacterium]